MIPRLPADLNFPEHPRLHVIKEMTVISPTAKRVGGNRIADALRWVDHHGVLAHLKLPVRILNLAPHAVQVNRVSHHRVVHERDTQSLAEVEAQWFGL